MRVEEKHVVRRDRVVDSTYKHATALDRIRCGIACEVDEWEGGSFRRASYGRLASIIYMPLHTVAAIVLLSPLSQQSSANIQ